MFVHHVGPDSYLKKCLIPMIFGSHIVSVKMDCNHFAYPLAVPVAPSSGQKIQFIQYLFLDQIYAKLTTLTSISAPLCLALFSNVSIHPSSSSTHSFFTVFLFFYQALQNQLCCSFAVNLVTRCLSFTRWLVVLTKLGVSVLGVETPLFCRSSSTMSSLTRQKACLLIDYRVDSPTYGSLLTQQNVCRLKSFIIISAHFL